MRCHSCRPHVEPLEDRTVPAITVFQSGVNTIVIQGNQAGDFVRVTDNGTNRAGAITVTGTGLFGVFQSAAVPVGQVIQVQIRTGGGADTVEYVLQGDLRTETGAGTARTGGRRITGELGTGNDELRFRATADVDVRAGAVLSVIVNGNAGRDRLSAQYRGEMDGSLTMILNGGPGTFNDRLAITETFDSGSTGFAFNQEVGGAGADIFVLLVQKPGSNTPPSVSQIFGGPGFDQGIRTPDIFSSSVEDTTVL